jgi:hypothetical protein
MKKMIYSAGLFVIVLSLSFQIHASNPNPAPSDKHEFKNTDREINFDIERKQGEIALYFQSATFNQFDEILVERCGSDNGSYSVCKTIEVSQVKIVDNYYKTSDKYPLNSHRDCYYRIKTVAKDGSMKTFPPVLLAALTE